MMGAYRRCEIFQLFRGRVREANSSHRRWCSLGACPCAGRNDDRNPTRECKLTHYLDASRVAHFPAPLLI